MKLRSLRFHFPHLSRRGLSNTNQRLSHHRLSVAVFLIQTNVSLSFYVSLSLCSCCYGHFGFALITLPPFVSCRGLFKYKQTSLSPLLLHHYTQPSLELLHAVLVQLHRLEEVRRLHCLIAFLFVPPVHFSTFFFHPSTSNDSDGANDFHHLHQHFIICTITIVARKAWL